MVMDEDNIAISHLRIQNANSLMKQNAIFFENKTVMRNKLCSNVSLVHHIKDAWRPEKRFILNERAQ